MINEPGNIALIGLQAVRVRANAQSDLDLLGGGQRMRGRRHRIEIRISIGSAQLGRVHAIDHGVADRIA